MAVQQERVMSEKRGTFRVRQRQSKEISRYKQQSWSHLRLSWKQPFAKSVTWWCSSHCRDIRVEQIMHQSCFISIMRLNALLFDIQYCKRHVLLFATNISLTLCLSLYTSVDQHTCLSNHTSIYQSINLWINQSINQSIYLSTYLSIYVCILPYSCWDPSPIQR